MCVGTVSVRITHGFIIGVSNGAIHRNTHIQTLVQVHKGLSNALYPDCATHCAHVAVVVVVAAVTDLQQTNLSAISR